MDAPTTLNSFRRWAAALRAATRGGAAILSVVGVSLRLMETSTMRQVCIGGVADGASFDQGPVPRVVNVAVHHGPTDWELEDCNCQNDREEISYSFYRIDTALSAAAGVWVYVPTEEEPTGIEEMEKW